MCTTANRIEAQTCIRHRHKLDAGYIKKGRVGQEVNSATTACITQGCDNGYPCSVGICVDRESAKRSDVTFFSQIHA